MQKSAKSSVGPSVRLKMPPNTIIGSSSANIFERSFLMLQMGGVIPLAATMPDKNMKSGIWKAYITCAATLLLCSIENMKICPITTKRIAMPFMRSI